MSPTGQEHYGVDFALKRNSGIGLLLASSCGVTI